CPRPAGQDSEGEQREDGGREVTVRRRTGESGGQIGGNDPWHQEGQYYESKAVQNEEWFQRLGERCVTKRGPDGSRGDGSPGDEAEEYTDDEYELWSHHRTSVGGRRPRRRLCSTGQLPQRNHVKPFSYTPQLP